MTPNLGSKYPKCVLTQIRLFLFISDVFLCISTIIFSKNMKLPNGRFLENLDSTASTGHMEQKSTLFAIFHQAQGVQGWWKIAKKRNHIAKFGCGSGAILVILFKKMGYFFSNIRKKWIFFKKNILKIINISLSTYSLMYVLKKKINFF